MPVFGGTGGAPAIYIQNVAPLSPAPGDFWFDTSAGTVLNFRTNMGSWLAVSIPTAALDTLSNAVSVLSQSVSVLSQSVSVLSNAVSVLSQQVSVISNQISVISQQVSVLSQSVSVLSNAVSVLSQSVSVLSQAVSVLSNQVSVLSQQVSVISQQISILSNQISVLSQQVSVISQQVSVISAGLGGMQMRVVANTQGISSTAAAGAAVSGMSVSVAAAGGIYQLEGILMVRMSAADAFGLSWNFPGMIFAAGTGIGSNLLTQTMSTIRGNFDEAGSNSIFLSIIMSTTSTQMIRLDGLFQVSTAGVIQLQARVSATTNPANILAGSYIRAHKLV